MAPPRACSGLAYSGVMTWTPVAVWRVLGRAVGVEQLRDAEVEELGHAVLGHQDVAGLEVAVDDQVAVGVLHGVADLGGTAAAASAIPRLSARRSSGRSAPRRRSSMTR